MSSVMNNSQQHTSSSLGMHSAHGGGGGGYESAPIPLSMGGGGGSMGGAPLSMGGMGGGGPPGIAPSMGTPGLSHHSQPPGMSPGAPSSHNTTARTHYSDYMQQDDWIQTEAAAAKMRSCFIKKSPGDRIGLRLLNFMGRNTRGVCVVGVKPDTAGAQASDDSRPTNSFFVNSRTLMGCTDPP